MTPSGSNSSGVPKIQYLAGRQFLVMRISDLNAGPMVLYSCLGADVPFLNGTVVCGDGAAVDLLEVDQEGADGSGLWLRYLRPERATKDHDIGLPPPLNAVTVLMQEDHLSGEHLLLFQLSCLFEVGGMSEAEKFMVAQNEEDAPVSRRNPLVAQCCQQERGTVRLSESRKMFIVGQTQGAGWRKERKRRLNRSRRCTDTRRTGARPYQYTHTTAFIKTLYFRVKSSTILSSVLALASIAAAVVIKAPLTQPKDCTDLGCCAQWCGALAHTPGYIGCARSLTRKFSRDVLLPHPNCVGDHVGASVLNSVDGSSGTSVVDFSSVGSITTVTTSVGSVYPVTTSVGSVTYDKSDSPVHSYTYIPPTAEPTA
ncbi:hypothetical protein B0H66DRAFT_532259 [Apodospora peruviana]|uniref:Uncharacterized protein n=1 Tax=Apodospora peruviana TaxID=516989 RepID=A0AAE0IES1_9PEZI|nr:hypothetical protein B0H66DRAFT_532259 [Apodospora peruviana]